MDNAAPFARKLKVKPFLKYLFFFAVDIKMQYSSTVTIPHSYIFSHWPLASDIL